jgi:general secretion pathway protein G
MKLSTPLTKKSRHDGGFTLIELLIVIVILGILAAVVAFSLTGATSQATKSACQANAKTVATALASFEAENPGSGAITKADILNSGTGVSSWPQDAAYSIGIASGADAGTEVTVAGTTYIVNTNDVLVYSGSTLVGDATQDPAGACSGI